mgnify:CR=1 FL=1
MEYIIPFRNIKRIEPIGYRYTIVQLKNGEELKLEDSQDVSEDNSGLLVFESSRPQYVVWDDIDAITFD